jgi:hypothetical protein
MGSCCAKSERGTAVRRPGDGGGRIQRGHRVNIALSGVCLASIWAVVADWIGGRPVMHKKTIPQIYQSFRQQGVAPLPPLSKAIKAAALLLAIAAVDYYFAR